MLVSEIIQGFIDGTVSRADLAEQFDVTERTITNKIKRLGYQWSKKEQKHEYIGDENLREKIDNTVFSSMFEDNYQAPKQSITGSNTASKKASTVTTNKNNKAPMSSNKSNQSSLFANEIDSIDSLFNEQKKEKKYRGFYIEEDLIKVIDSVAEGNKSKLVNESLRAVFKAKGLL